MQRFRETTRGSFFVIEVACERIACIGRRERVTRCSGGESRNERVMRRERDAGDRVRGIVEGRASGRRGYCALRCVVMVVRERGGWKRPRVWCKR